MIIGHQKIISQLNRSLEKGVFSQAYLFCGPESVGKFGVAKELAGKLTGPSGSTSGELLVISPSIEEQKGKIKKKDIRIDDVRLAQKHLSTTSFQNNSKVVIIDEADRLTVSAQNALLKILEEPPRKSFLFLITADAGKILPTIVSRCQVKKFNLLADEKIAEIVSESNGQNRKEIIFWSLGRPGAARKMIDNKEELERRRLAAEELRKIISGSVCDKFSLAEELSKDEVGLMEKLKWWAAILRASCLGRAAVFSVSPPKALGAIEKIEEAAENIKKTNASTRLILENLFLSI